MRSVEIGFISGCAFIMVIILILQVISLYRQPVWRNEICQITTHFKKFCNATTYLAIFFMNYTLIIISLAMEANCSICDVGYEMYRDIYILERVFTYIFFGWRAQQLHQVNGIDPICPNVLTSNCFNYYFPGAIILIGIFIVIWFNNSPSTFEELCNTVHVHCETESDTVSPRIFIFSSAVEIFFMVFFIWLFWKSFKRIRYDNKDSKAALWILVLSTINLTTSLIVYMGWGIDPKIMWWIVPLDNAANVVTLFLMLSQNREAISLGSADLSHATKLSQSDIEVDDTNSTGHESYQQLAFGGSEIQ
eukprot:142482_1